MSATSNFGKVEWLGWWWGVWQDDILVGFGAGYRDKRKAFRHEAACLERARNTVMPPVACTNPTIQKRAVADAKRLIKAERGKG